MPGWLRDNLPFRRRWTLETRAIVSASVVLALLLLIAFAQYATMRELENSLQWEVHSEAVERQLAIVRDDLSAVASSSSRFVDVPDPATLSTFRSDAAGLEADVDSLHAMVTDDAPQIARVEHLHLLATQRIASLRNVLAARRAGGSATEGDLALDRIAFVDTDPVQQMINAIRQDESQLLAQRVRRVADIRRSAVVWLAMGSVFAIGIVLWGATALRRDVAERSRAEAALSASEEALRQLSGHLLKSRDEERRKLARDLHDGTSQLLTAAQLRLAAAASVVPSGNAAAQASLAEVSSMLDSCAREIRALSHLLHPPLLDHTGIGPALRWYAEDFGRRSGIAVDVQAPDSIPRLSGETETALFRITQEALTNVLRHSGSRTATIKAGLENGSVLLEISDRGCGIPTGKLNAPARLGVGLRGMTERLRLLGGTLSIESGKGGTTVRAELPATDPEADRD